MPPPLLFDLGSIDLDKVIYDVKAIEQINPHRYEMRLLDGIVYLDSDAGNCVGFKEVREDEFWVRGHIPGRPIFPGVLMIETAAQLVSYYAMRKMPKQGFLGFGGVDDVKFRGSVVPGDRIVMVGKMVEVRRRRCVGDTQAFVNGNMVYEGRITGMWL